MKALQSTLIFMEVDCCQAKHLYSMVLSGIFYHFVFARIAKLLVFEENISFAEDRDIAYKLEEVAVPIFINKILYKQCIVPNSQSNDKRKAKIGFINHLKAKENALKRRQIFGFEMFYYRLIFWANHCRNSSRIPNRLFSPFINTLNVADDHFQIRSIGILRRPAAQKNVL